LNRELRRLLLTAPWLLGAVTSLAEEPRVTSHPAAWRADGRPALPARTLRKVALRATSTYEGTEGGLFTSVEEAKPFRVAIAEEADDAGLSVLPEEGTPQGADEGALWAWVSARDVDRGVSFTIELELLLPATFAGGGDERVLASTWRTRASGEAPVEDWPAAGVRAARKAVRAFADNYRRFGGLPGALPRSASALLGGPETKLTLLSLEPRTDAAAGAAESFHGFPVLGRVELTDAALRTRVIEALERGVRESDGGMAACFSPRHGIAARRGEATLDLVICYQCQQILLHGSDGAVRLFLTSASPDPTLTQALRDHGARITEH
jgi:hypothetical protein